MAPLSPSQKKVLRVRGAIAALVLLVVPTILGFRLLGDWPLLQAALVAAALVFAFFLVVVAPERRYRSWAYAVTEDELHVGNGIWFRSRTVVPFGRVQHIDLGQGPIERHYGVATLTLYTAGTRSAAVPLPGLDLEDAERMRDEIRGKIRQDLA